MAKNTEASTNNSLWPDSKFKRTLSILALSFTVTMVLTMALQIYAYQDPNAVKEIRSESDFSNLGTLALLDTHGESLTVTAVIPQATTNETIYFRATPAVEMGGAEIDFRGGEPIPTSTTGLSGSLSGGSSTSKPPLVLTEGGNDIYVSFGPEDFRASGKVGAVSVGPCSDADPTKMCQISQPVDPSMAHRIIAACMYGPNAFTASKIDELGIGTDASSELRLAVDRRLAMVSDQRITGALLPNNTGLSNTEAPPEINPLEGISCRIG